MDELISKSDVVKIIKSVLSPASSLIPVARARRQMLNEINDLESKPEPHWIPVTERLPEKHGAYIVCYSDFRHGIYYGRVIAVAWFDLGDTWLKYRCADNARTFPPKLHHVIAWMPLPEPFKGVTE